MAVDLVLVIGAGPVGLLAALLLRQRGVPVRIVDRHATLTPLDRSKALAVHAPSLHILHALGLFTRLQPYVCNIHGVRYHGADGADLGGVRFHEALHGHTPFAQVAAVPQGVTERVLYEHFVQLGGTVEWCTEATVHVDLAADAAGPGQGPPAYPPPASDPPPGPVRVTLRTTGSIAVIEAAYVLACEGSHSSVRKAANIGFAGKTYTEHFVLADAILRVADSFDRTAFNSIFLPQQSMMVFPMRGPLVSTAAAANAFELPDLADVAATEAPAGHIFARMVVVDHTPGDPQNTSVIREHGLAAAAVVDEGAELAQLAPIAQRLGATIERVTWITRFGVNARMASHFSRGRLYLCGDAAHIHSPAGGHGMNSGFADVVNLTWKLAVVHHGHAADPAALLASYATEREHMIAAVLANTDRLSVLSMANSTIVRAVRDFSLPLLTRLTYVQETAALNLCMLGYGYAPGAAVGPFVRGPHPLAGRHLPHAVVTEVTEQTRDAGFEVSLLDIVADVAKDRVLVLAYVPAGARWAPTGAAIVAVRASFPESVIAVVVIIAATADHPLDVQAPIYVDRYGQVGRHVGAAAARVVVRPDLYIGTVCDKDDGGQDDIRYLSSIFFACAR